MDEFLKSMCHSVLNTDTNMCKPYLKRVINILAQYSWIYSFRNIDIFLHEVLEQIPIEWVNVLVPLSSEELWQLPFSYIKDEWPISLKVFIKQCNELAEFRFPQETFQDIIKGKNSCTLKKASEKKQLEVQIMSHLVHKICVATKSNVVLDIGSGLGYLDQALHYNFQICSIGIDSVPKYTLAAQKRLEKDSCKHSMIHEILEVNNSKQCLLELENILNKRSNLFCNCSNNIQDKVDCQSSSVLMVGLHSCGNLMQDMMKLFCELKEVTAFACVGCCYNKINLCDFPMSILATSAVTATQKEYPTWSPCITGLRLGAHGTRSHTITSSEESNKEKNLFYRALLEYFIKIENLVWKQPKRHIRTSYLDDFPTYCSKMFENHSLSGNESILKKLNSLHKEKEWLFERIRILLVLQTLLQPVWEAFVTIDRVMFFKERNISAEVIALWDDSLSARNLALCAF